MALADLSRTIESGMPVFPGDPPVAVDPHATMDADGYRVSALALGSHTGTHLDAPSHTEPDGATVEALPVSRFVRDAVRVDLRDHPPEGDIRPADLPTVDAAALVLWTGWDRYWGDPDYRDHPSLTPAAARHCAEQGYDVAIDALSVDPTPATDGVPAHHELLGDGRLIVENLTNLDTLPDRFELSTLPLKLGGGDGAPVRAVARWDCS